MSAWAIDMSVHNFVLAQHRGTNHYKYVAKVYIKEMDGNHIFISEISYELKGISALY